MALVSHIISERARFPTLSQKGHGFPHYLRKGTDSHIISERARFPTLSQKGHGFRNYVIEHKTYILICYIILCETFLILRRTERDMIKEIYICLHVKYPLFLTYFNEIIF
jgi:hypothetical protein